MAKPARWSVRTILVVVVVSVAATVAAPSIGIRSDVRASASVVPHTGTQPVAATWYEGTEPVDPDTAPCDQWLTTTPPSGTVSAEVTVSGAGGGGGGYYDGDAPSGGSGAAVTTTLTGAAVGSTLSVELGCGGADGGGNALVHLTAPAGGKGYEDGGSGGIFVAPRSGALGGGGGGGSALCIGTATCTVPVVVAGAGGGAGGEHDCTTSDSGGSGGSGVGSTATTVSGTQVLPGSGGDQGDDGDPGGGGQVSSGGSGGNGDGPPDSGTPGAPGLFGVGGDGGSDFASGLSTPYSMSGGGGGGGGYTPGGGGGPDRCLVGGNAGGGGGAGSSAVFLSDAQPATFTTGAAGGVGNSDSPPTTPVVCPEASTALLTGCPGWVTLTWEVSTTVTGVSPDAGPVGGGTPVVITGSGFTGATAVDFEGVAAAFDVVSPTSITATAPAAADTTTDSTVDITVTSPSGTSATGPADRFAYDAPPVVTGVAPPQGGEAGSTEVAIAGGPFTGASQVRFGTALASDISVENPSLLVAFSPAGTGTVDVTVTTPGGTSATGTADRFTYEPPPTVTGVAPSEGPTTGGEVTISGTDFFSDVTGVFFGLQSATYIQQSDGQVVAEVPAAGAGTVDVTVTTPYGTSAVGSADHYTYVAPPTVSSVAPDTGPAGGGTTVTITGTGLSGGSTVLFGDLPATGVVVDSPTELTAVSPPGSGAVDVVVATPEGRSATSSADIFTYGSAPSPPTVTGVDPAAGPQSGGTAVDIEGTGFTGVQAVYFGSTGATYTVVSPTEITATSPPGSGATSVSVVTSGGLASRPFTYLPVPAVTSVDPSSGPLAGGTVVTVTGSGLSDATAVSFGSAAATFTVVSDTEITATSPPGTGTVDVTVTTPGGSSVARLDDQFTYRPLPTVSSIGPSEGSAAGGTRVAIEGTGLGGVQQVFFGTTPASAIGSDEAGLVVATAPPGAGTVDVTVVTSGGTSAITSADQFTYVPVPQVTSVGPNAGPMSGGTSVTITGSSLLGATSVQVGDVPARYVVVSATAIDALIPPGSGTVDVTVTTPGGTSPTVEADRYTYAPVPTVTGLAPSTGGQAGGGRITITGSGFTGVTWVSFGGRVATDVVADSSTELTATVPSGSGTADVSVFTVGGFSTTEAGDRYTYVAPPSVIAVTPSEGVTAGGTPVAVVGSGFGGATRVTFGGVPATDLVVHSPGLLTVASPPGSGTVTVAVTTPDGTSGASSGSRFTYGAAGPGTRLVAADGGVFTFGDAPFEGSLGGTPLNRPIVGMAPTPDGLGYWLVAADGGVFTFGDAPFEGSLGGTPLNQPIVGMAATADGRGYWLVAADGGVFSFGDAPFDGSLGAQHLNQPIVGIAATADGSGYWLVAADGGVFSFGDAVFYGSKGGQHLNRPIVGMVPTPDGLGYWLVGADGGVFTFGAAPFDGSMGGQHLNRPIVAMAATPDGLGYRLVAADGGVFTFGNAPFEGSLAGTPLNRPIVGATPAGPVG